MITFYDLAGNDSKTWSPNPWKTRYVLNFKQLPYRTIYLEFEDIPDVSIKAGIPPSSKGPDGSPKYTVPAIVDDATGVAISDSYKIAEYLDEQYPDTPKVIPEGTESLQAAFYQNINEEIRPYVVLMITTIPRLLSERDKKYYYSTREKMFGKPLDEVKPKGEELEATWKKFEVWSDQVAGWYAKSSGPFLTGEKPTFGDFTVGGIFEGFRIITGQQSEEWKRISEMSGGRWEKLLNNLEMYADLSS